MATMKTTLNQTTKPFNLDYTLQCGQVFRWEKRGDWWYGVVAGKAIKIRQTRDVMEYEGAKTDFIEKYFRLHDPLPVILSRISKDVYIRDAIRNFHGLRLIRQDPWECLISYICATYKNIPAIKSMVNNLSKQFGSEMTFDDYRFYAFPGPDSLANASVTELARCKLGFRAKNVQQAARQVENGSISFDELESMRYEAAKHELLKLPGIGSKVADCVLLFSLNKLEAFPVDVWIKRTILNNYHEHFDDTFIQKASTKKSSTSSEYRRISSFARGYFGEYAGYAQQYLFHNERSACHRA
jgi:N-glycosylase/DNA lyase